MKKKKFETNCRFDVFKKCTTHFSLLMGYFLGPPNESSPRLERFAAQQASQSNLLGKSQKTRLRPRTSCGRGPNCQPLDVQHSSDGSRSLTTLTMPHREHQGDGRRRGLGRGRRGAGEDTAVDAHAERSMTV